MPKLRISRVHCLPHVIILTKQFSCAYKEFHWLSVMRIYCLFANGFANVSFKLCVFRSLTHETKLSELNQLNSVSYNHLNCSTLKYFCV